MRQGILIFINRVRQLVVVSNTFILVLLDELFDLSSGLNSNDRGVWPLLARRYLSWIRHNNWLTWKNSSLIFSIRKLKALLDLSFFFDALDFVLELNLHLSGSQWNLSKFIVARVVSVTWFNSVTWSRLRFFHGTLSCLTICWMPLVLKGAVR